MDYLSFFSLENIKAKLSEYSTTEVALIIFIFFVVVSIIIFIFYDKGAKRGFASLGSLGTSEYFSADGDDTTYGTPLKSIEELNLIKKKTVLLVYDEGCPHCRSFKSIWTSLLNDASLNEIAEFRSVGSNEKHVRSQIETLANVNGYPTVLIKQSSSDSFTEYIGAREFASLKLFIST